MAATESFKNTLIFTFYEKECLQIKNSNSFVNFKKKEC